MIQKPSNQVLAGDYYFSFGSLSNGDLYPTNPTGAYPGMISYGLGSGVIISYTSNLLGTGSKTFVFGGFPGAFSVGDLIKITSQFPVNIPGTMLGSVTSFSYDAPTNTGTIVVDVYQFTGTGTATGWRIIQQWGSTSNNTPLNVVQNPNSPATAKMCVFDWEGFGLANFNVPAEINNETTITSDTPTLFSGYTITKWKSQTDIIEDVSELHKPWLGTTVTVRVKIKKVTTTLDGSTFEYENRDYTHTFTAGDFSPSSAGFIPGVGHSPSQCINFSENYIDEFTSTFNVVYNSEGETLSATYVNYYFEEESRVISVNPVSFFEPPT